MARPITANMAHGCSPQWKNEYSIAICAAAGEPASTSPSGGELKWVSGSETP